MKALSQLWQLLAQKSARLFQLETALAHCSVEPMYLSEGSIVVEVVEVGRPVLITTLSGSVRVKRTDRKTFNMVAHPGQPVVLFVPGQYSIRARTEVYGLRGERCPTH